MTRQGSQDKGRSPIIYTFVEGVDDNHAGRERLSNRKERFHDQSFELVRQVRVAYVGVRLQGSSDFVSKRMTKAS